MSKKPKEKTEADFTAMPCDPQKHRTMDELERDLMYEERHRVRRRWRPASERVAELKFE